MSVFALINDQKTAHDFSKPNTLFSPHLAFLQKVYTPKTSQKHVLSRPVTTAFIGGIVGTAGLVLDNFYDCKASELHARLGIVYPKHGGNTGFLHVISKNRHVPDTLVKKLQNADYQKVTTLLRLDARKPVQHFTPMVESFAKTADSTVVFELEKNVTKLKWLSRFTKPVKWIGAAIIAGAAIWGFANYFQNKTTT